MTAQIVVEGSDVVENGEAASNGGASCTATVGVVAPSCYRVSVVSGSLEVTARLKNADDFDLFMKVLQANAALFAKTEEPAALANKDQPKSKSSAKTDRSQTEVKADRPTSTLHLPSHASR
jgi:hypothetical protein